MAKKFEVIGKNTEFMDDDGVVQNPEVGDVVESTRDLDKIWLNKFKSLSKKAAAARKPAARLAAAEAEEAEAQEEEDADYENDLPGDGVDVNKPAKGKKGKAGAKAGDKEKSETPEYVDVSDKYPDAKKHDLAVFEYPGGEFQVFDADDKDKADAAPVNPAPLKTVKSLEAFLKSH